MKINGDCDRVKEISLHLVPFVIAYCNKTPISLSLSGNSCGNSMI